ncbi:MAG TPA: hypothetical protein VF327_10035 [Gaiellaceae bacterium]
MNRREFALLAAAAPFGLRAALAGAPSALVTCDAEERLAVVDLGSYRTVRSIATLPDPRSIELAVGGVVHQADLAPQHVTFGRGVAYVTSGDSGTLHVQDHGGGS